MHILGAQGSPWPLYGIVAFDSCLLHEYHASNLVHNYDCSDIHQGQAFPGALDGAALCTSQLILFYQYHLSVHQTMCFHILLSVHMKYISICKSGWICALCDVLTVVLKFKLLISAGMPYIGPNIMKQILLTNVFNDTNLAYHNTDVCHISPLKID